jgi:hypothetical protein
MSQKTCYVLYSALIIPCQPAERVIVSYKSLYAENRTCKNLFNDKFQFNRIYVSRCVCLINLLDFN